MEPISPAISVLMPLFNSERWLSQAIESVLAQTFGDFELVVVDDGSTDGSAAIVESFAERDPRVRLVRTPHAGVRAARSVSLAEARAPLVAFLDADDEWLPQRLERQLPYVDARTLVFADAVIADPSGQTGARYSDWCPVPEAEYPVQDLFEDLLAGGCFVHIATVLAPRDPLLEAGAFRYGETRGLPSDGAGSDFEMWLLLALEGLRFHYVDEPLAVYRRHPHSLTAEWLTELAAEAAVLDGLRPLVRGRHRRPLRRARGRARGRLEVLYRKRGWQQLVAGESGAARRDLLRSLRSRPGSPRAWLALLLALCPPLARRLVQGRV